MIKELSGKKQLYYDDKLFKKYFSEKIPTDNEEEKKEEFKNLLDEFCLKVYRMDSNAWGFFPHGFIFGYLEDFGYYILTVGDRGYYNLDNYGEDIEEAFKNIVTEILSVYAMDYEFENRKSLKEDFSNRFGNMEYSGCIYFAENALQIWDLFYDGNIPKEIVDFYDDYLNRVCGDDANVMIWKFNTATKSFEYKNKNEIMDGKKAPSLSKQDINN